MEQKLNNLRTRLRQCGDARLIRSTVTGLWLIYSLSTSLNAENKFQDNKESVQTGFQVEGDLRYTMHFLKLFKGTDMLKQLKKRAGVQKELNEFVHYKYVVYYANGNWSIRLIPDKGLEKYPTSYLEASHDGQFIYEFEPRNKKIEMPSATNHDLGAMNTQETRNSAIGKVYMGKLPMRNNTILSSIWFAYASAAQISEWGEGAVEMFWLESGGDGKIMANFEHEQVPAQLKLLSPGGLPEKMIRKPAEGKQMVTYEVIRSTNVFGIKLPMEFQLRVYNSKTRSLKSEYYGTTELIRRIQDDDVPIPPTITQPTLVSDFRSLQTEANSELPDRYLISNGQWVGQENIALQPDVQRRREAKTAKKKFEAKKKLLSYFMLTVVGVGLLLLVGFCKNKLK